MNIKLVEDSKLKADKICRFVCECFPDFNFEIYGSYQSGLKSILRDFPDLIILDMSLPTYDRCTNQREGRLRPLGGYDIMRKLNMRGIDFKALVITQLESFGDEKNPISFNEIHEKCKNEFGDMYLGSIFFGQSDDSWKSELEKVLNRYD